MSRVRTFLRDWMASSKVTAAGLASMVSVFVFDRLDGMGYTFDQTTVALTTGLVATVLAYVVAENRPAPIIVPDVPEVEFKADVHLLDDNRA